MSGVRLVAQDPAMLSQPPAKRLKPSGLLGPAAAAGFLGPATAYCGGCTGAVRSAAPPWGQEMPGAPPAARASTKDGLSGGVQLPRAVDAATGVSSDDQRGGTLWDRGSEPNPPPPLLLNADGLSHGHAPPGHESRAQPRTYCHLDADACFSPPPSPPAFCTAPHLWPVAPLMVSCESMATALETFYTRHSTGGKHRHGGGQVRDSGCRTRTEDETPAAPSPSLPAPSPPPPPPPSLLAQARQHAPSAQPPPPQQQHECRPRNPGISAVPITPPYSLPARWLQTEAPRQVGAPLEPWAGVGLLSHTAPAAHLILSKAMAAAMQPRRVSTMVRDMVSALRHEDPRLPSPRINLLISAFQKSPLLRLPILQALTQAAYDRMLHVREVTASFMRDERDMNPVLSKDHGVGLAELLAACTLCIREEIGAGAPVVSDDDDTSSLDDERWTDEHSALMDDGLPSAAMEMGDRGEGFMGNGAGSHQPLDGEEEAETDDMPPAMPAPARLVSQRSYVREEGKDGERVERAMAVAPEDKVEPQLQRLSALVPPDESLGVAEDLDAKWMYSKALLREVTGCLRILLRCHAKKLASPVLDRMEMEHIRDVVAEVLSAYPPLGVEILDILLKVWPRGNSTREMGFLSLLTLILVCSPVLPRLESQARAHVRAFNKLAACAWSAHAGVAEAALSSFSNPRLMAMYMWTNSVAGSKEITGIVMKCVSEVKQSHWHPEIRKECECLSKLLLQQQSKCQLARAH